jgi:hypothetical protein
MKAVFQTTGPMSSSRVAHAGSKRLPNVGEVNVDNIRRNHPLLKSRKLCSGAKNLAGYSKNSAVYFIFE